VELTLAADVYGTIARLAEEDFDGDLLIDSFLRLGYCKRMLGELGDAEASYAMAGKIAKRQKDTARALRSQIGSATVVMMRGNLPKAEELLAKVATDSEFADCTEVTSNALHVRSVVAHRRGEIGRAVCLAYDALRCTALPNDRDRILADIGAYFIVMERFEAAHDALMILEATASTTLVRLQARINMVALAARAGYKDLFASSRTRLEGVTLPPENRVNFLIESARGLRLFGEPEVARGLLEQALELAIEHEFNRSIFEAEEMLAERAVEANTQSGGIRFEQSEATAGVELELRKLALAVA
jgi:tetratricopeptide (TPR) repeat protein